MRAVYIENLETSDEYSLKDEAYHHLAHVVRASLGDRILLLNGKGLEVECEINTIVKGNIKLKKIEIRHKKLHFHIDIALGVPKKDALDLSLKQAVELGIHSLFLIRSQYSQNKLPEVQRIHKVLTSALEQSNSPHLTEVLNTDFSQIPYSDYETVLLFDSQEKAESRAEFKKGKTLLVIGPEGGFSPDEMAHFKSIPNLERVNLPLPIMRTPTALSCGVGVVLQRLMD